MSLDLVLEGSIQQIFSVVTGEGRNGTWERQAFLVEVPGRYPTQVYLEVWGEKRKILSPYREGDKVRVWIDLSSREFNGRWYTSARAFRIEGAGSANQNGDGVPANAETVKPFDYGAGEQDRVEDDLPF